MCLMLTVYTLSGLVSKSPNSFVWTFNKFVKAGLHGEIFASTHWNFSAKKNVNEFHDLKFVLEIL